MPSSLNASLTTSHCQMRPLKWRASSVMCLRRRARSSSAVKSPVVSQAGSWLCQSRVWPRTSWPLARAKSTSLSACFQSYWPRLGSTTSHFMTFSGVTELNSLAAFAR